MKTRRNFIKSSLACFAGAAGVALTEKPKPLKKYEGEPQPIKWLEVRGANGVMNYIPVY